MHGAGKWLAFTSELKFGERWDTCILQIDLELTEKKKKKRNWVGNLMGPRASKYSPHDDKPLHA